eukprot:TRINITY_DN1975_c0_g1_i1.p1 TRINITY_DN1975_c0_g1~~TRINITY_DN1975_c0_g1_i1.p1  ORF type:complete len:842 (+),score=90.99 TRINITY_DN1975_c0_g1_i1:96-2528(+)
MMTSLQHLAVTFAYMTVAQAMVDLAIEDMSVSASGLALVQRKAASLRFAEGGKKADSYLAPQTGMNSDSYLALKNASLLPRTKYCAPLENQTLYQTIFVNLGKKSDLETCYKEALGHDYCRRFANFFKDKFHIIYNDTNCGCRYRLRPKDEDRNKTLLRQQYVCSFPYPDECMKTEIEAPIYQPTGNTSTKFAVLPNTTDMEQCLMFAMASGQCGKFKSSQLSFSFYVILFGLDYCRCAKESGMQLEEQGFGKTGGRRYICGDVPTPSPTLPTLSPTPSPTPRDHTKYCQPLTKQKGYSTIFKSLGRKSSLEICYKSAVGHTGCKQFAKWFQQKVHLIYDNRNCGCRYKDKPAEADKYKIFDKKQFVCSFPYPEKCLYRGIGSPIYQPTPPTGSKVVSLPKAKDVEQCLEFAMASGECIKLKSSKISFRFYVILFGLDYCRCAKEHDMEVVKQEGYGKSGGQRFLCDDIPTPSPTFSPTPVPTPSPVKVSFATCDRKHAGSSGSGHYATVSLGVMSWTVLRGTKVAGESLEFSLPRPSDEIPTGVTVMSSSSDAWCISGVALEQQDGTMLPLAPLGFQVWVDSPCKEPYYSDDIPCYNSFSWKVQSQASETWPISSSQKWCCRSEGKCKAADTVEQFGNYVSLDECQRACESTTRCKGIVYGRASRCKGDNKCRCWLAHTCNAYKASSLYDVYMKPPPTVAPTASPTDTPTGSPTDAPTDLEDDEEDSYVLDDITTDDQKAVPFLALSPTEELGDMQDDSYVLDDITTDDQEAVSFLARSPALELDDVTEEDSYVLDDITSWTDDQEAEP